MITIDNDEKREAALLLVSKLTKATADGALKWKDSEEPSFVRELVTKYGDIELELSVHSDGTPCSLTLHNTKVIGRVYIASTPATKDALEQLLKATQPAGPFGALPGWVREMYDSLD